MMKQVSRPLFAAPLYVVLALLLFFGSCQSSDNAKISEGASVASLPLTAQIGEASSRMGMSDTYGGTFSCYWNSDKFNVYHPYVLNGAVQSMEPLEFATSANGGVSAKFAYTGKDAYRYNPGARIFAFSKGTSGNYTTSVTADKTGTLTANALASQKGTLTDCATYDALYGSAGVDYNMGLPGTLAMHHLFGMMNLHLTSSSFSTSYPVTVKLTSSAANMLPGNGGNATLKADGITLTQNNPAGTWGTSWSATITPTTPGVVDVYFMTWPFTSISGTLIVSCSDASDYVYADRTITLNGFGLAAAQLKSKPLAIANTPPDDTYSKVYAWDATDSQPTTFNTASTNVNKISTSIASYACKDCPNYNEISWYMSVPCYWDAGGISGGNTTVYRMCNGTTTKAGMWFRKRSGIEKFSSTVSSGVTKITPIKLSTMTAEDISNLGLSTNYFFLPAVGHMVADGSFSTSIFYWSSTAGFDTSFSYAVHFASIGVYLDGFNRPNCYCLWQGQ